MAAAQKIRGPFKKVVIILSAPRSGSSFLYSLLTSHPQVIHFGGEETPLLKRFMTNWENFRDERDLLIPPARLAEWWPWLSKLVGSTAPGGRPNFYHYQERFKWQWQRELQLDPRDFKALDCLQKNLGPDFFPFYDRGLNLAGQAQELNSDLISPYEDTPYCWPEHFSLVPESELGERVLVLKTSTNNYRAPWLLDLFHPADISFIALKRRAEASLQGLLDGWDYPGFHSFNIYKLRGKRTPRGHDYFKFDLFPGWEEALGLSHEELVATQLIKAHGAMSEFLTQYRPRFKEVRYEVLCDPRTRSQAMSDLCHWLGLPPFDNFNFTQKRMASNRTGSERWRARSEELEQILRGVPGGAQLQERLAYE